MASTLAPIAHEPVQLDPRRCFTPRQKASLFTRSKGRCDLCGDKIRGKWIAGHVIAHALGGRTILDNSRVECVACGKQTHADDTGTAAKCERMAGRKGQYARRRKNGPQIKSRGFSKVFRKKINGKVERRI